MDRVPASLDDARSLVVSALTQSADETFDFLAWTFDIATLREILAKPGTPDQLSVVQVADVSRFLESDPLTTAPEVRRVPFMGVDVLWPRIDELSSNALTSPVFVASLGQVGSFVIDGWHRIALARRLGVKELPAIQLTRRQTQRILLPRSAPLPPEKKED